MTTVSRPFWLGQGASAAAGARIRQGGGGGLTLIIDSDRVDLNVYDEFVSQIGVPPINVTFTLQINPDVVISASSTSVPAMTWGNAWTGTPHFSMINQGFIIGHGGDGGLGADDGPCDAAGSPGGNAMEMEGYDCEITNIAGSIWGGGGGGGGAGATFDGSWHYGGGGGGGAGDGVGAAGQCGFAPNPPQAGTDAVDTSASLQTQTGGPGGEFGHDAGSGGDYGLPGQDAAAFPGLGKAGGAAGKAINLSGGTVDFQSGGGSPNVKGDVS